MIDNIEKKIILDYLEVDVKLREIGFELIGSQENKKNMYYKIKKVTQVS